MDLERLIRPRSIAIVGATERASIGREVIGSLERLGFDGRVLPVNPKYKSVLGHTCYRDLDSIDGEIDLVVLCLGHRQVPSQLERAAALGVGGAVIYGSGYAEAGEDGQRLQAAITALCKDAGIALCGPNCMGISSPHARCHSYMLRLDDSEAFAGNVGLVSQSGSVCIGLTTDVRRYGFSHVISSGNEAVVSSAAFLEYLVQDDDTEMIALFAESVSEPERFVAALDAAVLAGKPVVVLKVGKSRRAAAAVATHTGGLAGEARVFSAVLRAHRAIEVSTLEDMSEVLAACQVRPLPTDARVGIVTASGGHAELMLDLAEGAGVDLPPLAPALRTSVEQVVGPLTGDGNPVDAWGNGDYATNFPVALSALGDSSEHGTILLAVDGFDGQPMHHGSIAKECAAIMGASKTRSNKPHFLLSTLRGVFSSEQITWLRQCGVPLLSGISSALSTIAKLVAYARPVPEQRPVPAVLSTERQSHLRGRTTVHEHDAKQLLAEYGLPVSSERVVHSLNEALPAADVLGYPVALKALSDGVAHRTDHGLVRLGIRDGNQLTIEWDALQDVVQNLSHEGAELAWLVQSMIAPGVEVIVGVKHDPIFGHALVVGPGGVLAEMLDEVSVRLLPLRYGDAQAMIEDTRLCTLLRGVRGEPAADRDSLVRAIESVADFAAANAAWIESIDINPIIVHQRGCIAVDALIVPRPLTYEESK